MKKLPLLLGPTALALGGAGFFAGRYYYPGHLRASAHAAAATEVQAPVYLPLDNFTLRLADTGDEHYLKFAPVLAVRPGSQDELTRHLPMVRDAILLVASSSTSTELMTPAGARKLKHDIIEALKRPFPGAVSSLYFKDYLVE